MAAVKRDEAVGISASATETALVVSTVVLYLKTLKQK
jgi:hypothetical protein